MAQKSLLFLLEEKVYLYSTVDGEGELIRFLHNLHLRFVVTTVIMGAGLLRLHAKKSSLSMTVCVECRGVAHFQHGRDGVV